MANNSTDINHHSPYRPQPTADYTLITLHSLPKVQLTENPYFVEKKDILIASLVSSNSSIKNYQSKSSFYIVNLLPWGEKAIQKNGSSLNL